MSLLLGKACMPNEILTHIRKISEGFDELVRVSKGTIATEPIKKHKAVFISKGPIEINTALLRS